MRATDNLADQLKLIMQLKHRQILNRLGDSLEAGFKKLPNDDNKSTQWELQDIINVKMPSKTQETLIFNKNIDPAVLKAEEEISAVTVAFDELTSKENVIKLLKQ